MRLTKKSVAMKISNREKIAIAMVIVAIALLVLARIYLRYELDVLACIVLIASYAVSIDTTDWDED